MSDYVQTAIVEILKAVQASIAGLDQRMTALERGHTELKEIARRQRRDLAGLLVMMKASRETSTSGSATSSGG